MAASPLQKSPSAKLFDVLVPFLVVLIFAGVFGLSFYYVIQPELQKYLPGGQQNYPSVKELHDSRVAYRNDLQSLAEFVAQTSSDAQDPITWVLPSNDDVPTLYALFEKIAKDVNVGLQVIDIANTAEDAIKTKSQIRSVPIELRFVNVDYATLKRLITTLESNIRLTTLESLSYDPLGETVSIAVHTYYFAER